MFLSSEGAPPGKLTLKAMDHTHVFTPGAALSPKLAHLDQIRDPDVYGLFPEFRKRISLEAGQRALEDLANLPRQVVEAAVRSIPPEWDVRNECAAALVDFVVRRAAYLTQSDDGMMRLFRSQGRLSFPGPEGDVP